MTGFARSLTVIAVPASLLAGCTASPPATTTPVPDTFVYVTTVPTARVVTDEFSEVREVAVTAERDNRDADAEDDGLVVRPRLPDANERTVEWDDPLRVDIEVWSARDGDELVHRGTDTLERRDDAVRIPFDDMTGSREGNGRVCAEVFTPDGRSDGWRDAVDLGR